LPPPQGPIDIPPEALSALASLRSRFEHRLPPGASFGIGVKQTGGQFEDQLAIVVYVPEKFPVDQLLPDQVIPAVWNDQGADFVTDVVQSNPSRAALVNDTSFSSPLLGGIEIGWSEPIGVGLVTVHRGTLGCIVQRRSDGARQFLTANHVAPLNTDVSQPAPGGFNSSVIGTVFSADVDWDCSAIAPNGTRGTPSPTVKELGAVHGSATAQLWSVANKRGRTTGLTTGVVTAFVYDAALSITRVRLATFPFGGLYCWDGDSGSAILNGNNEVIGLLLEKDNETQDAGGTPLSSEGLAAPIQAVLDALDVEIGVSPPVVTQVQPDTALAVPAAGGFVQLDGLGFDAGSRVAFGGVAALSVVPASPTRLIVTPPLVAPGVTADVIVTNGLGEQSLASPSARFTF
jgi:hypothetical protein